MSRTAALLALLAGGCAADAGPCAFPDAASDPGGVVSNTDACGFWALAVGDHLYLDLHVTTELPTCVAQVGDGLSIPNDPIYTNMADDGPKYTYDIVADAPTDAAAVDITCDEGTSWHAQVAVQ